MKIVRTCAGCRHAEEYYGSMRCRAAHPTVFNVVSGKSEPEVGRDSCSTQRRQVFWQVIFEGWCGTKGRLWEPIAEESKP